MVTINSSLEYLKTMFHTLFLRTGESERNQSVVLRVIPSWKTVPRFVFLVKIHIKLLAHLRYSLRMGHHKYRAIICSYKFQAFDTLLHQLFVAIPRRISSGLLETH